MSIYLLFAITKWGYLSLYFAALTVRFLTRRFIGEYGDIGKL